MNISIPVGKFYIKSGKVMVSDPCYKIGTWCQGTLKNIKKGPIGFDNDIMNGISDKFAFTKIDQPLPHTYFGVNDEDKNVIFTAPEGKKMDKGDHLKNMKDIEERRNIQDSQNASFMKQKQIEAVMTAEHEKLGMPNIQQQQYLMPA
jgi:hypothetical protein